MEKNEGFKTAEDYVRLISSFSPQARGQSIFDEQAARLSKKNSHFSIRLPAPYVDEIEQTLLSDEPCSVLITGIAGDGKTYHARQLWERLGGDFNSWVSDKEKSGSLCIRTTTRGKQPHSRAIYFIQDLSAKDYEAIPIIQNTQETIFDLLIRSITDAGCSVVICCNHGQLLKRLRSSGRPECPKLADQIENTFFSPKGEISLKETPEIKVFDLSRLPQHKNFDEIVKQFCDHEAWESCQTCDICKICQIRENRKWLWDTEKKDFTDVERKISSLIKLTGLDGNHLPIRDLLTLVSNSMVGCNNVQSNKAGVPSNSCARARYAAENPDKLDMDFFDNILGNNYTRRGLAGKEIFNVLSQYECGVAGDRLWDRFLQAEGHMENSDTPGMGVDLRELYNSYKDKLSDVPEASGPEDDEKDPETILLTEDDAAEKKRRKLFFLLPDTDETYPSGWKLTSLKHAREYLSLLDRIRENRKRGLGLPADLVRGLNRILTGGTLEDADEIIVTTNGTFADCFAGRKVAARVTARNGRHEWSRLEWDPQCEEELSPPVIDFCFDDAIDGASVRFELTPSRYECLASSADGAIIETFSEKIINDFMNLKSELIVAYEKFLSEEESSDDDPRLELTEEGQIETIEIHYA